MEKFFFKILTTESELIYFIRKFNDTNGSKKTIEAYEQSILELKNPKLSFYFAKEIKGANIKEHEQVVLDSKSPEWNYYFSREIEGADIEEHRKVIVASGEPSWNYYFSNLLARKNLPGLNECEQVIIDSGEPQWNYLFAFAINNSNSEHERVVRTSADQRWICLFEHDVVGIDITKSKAQKSLGTIK